MSTFELILFWSAILSMAVSFFFSLLSLIFKRPGGYKTGSYVIVAGYILLTIFGIYRWTISGHPPFVTSFESMITSIWFFLTIYLLLQKFTKHASILLIPVSLFSFLLLGWSSSMPLEVSPLSAALSNVWLFIHASFATCGAASFLIAASFSVLYLMGEERLQSYEKIAGKIPARSFLPKSILNLMIFGLILWGVMIVSGAIWANIAWGRYWAWDPIELWSLISWLLYGLVLHTRLTFKVSHNRFCWLTIIAAITIVFSLWGVGYIYDTIHSYG